MRHCVWALNNYVTTTNCFFKTTYRLPLVFTARRLDVHLISSAPLCQLYVIYFFSQCSHVKTTIAIIQQIKSTTTTISTRTTLTIPNITMITTKTTTRTRTTALITTETATEIKKPSKNESYQNNES